MIKKSKKKSSVEEFKKPSDIRLANYVQHFYTDMFDFAEPQARNSVTWTDFHSVVRELDANTKRSSKPCVRPSRIPACGIKLFLEMCEGEKNGYNEDNSIRNVYFTSTGTLTHSILQRFASYTGKCLGNYVCIPCNHRVEWTMDHECPKCGKPMWYEEIEINNKGLKGHVDGLWRYKNTNWFIVIDYKGTNSKSVDDKKKHQYFPKMNNVKQVSTYCSSLEKMEEFKSLGYNILGFALIYGTRDDPQKALIRAKTFTEKDFKVAGKLVVQQRNQQKALDLADNDYDVSALIENKPCPNLAYYQKEMHDSFAPCSLTSICFSAPKQLKEILEDCAEDLKECRAKLSRKKKKKKSKPTK